MSLNKSLREIREIFNGYVDPDFINYLPNHGWIIHYYELSGSEWHKTSSSPRITLYHALRSAFDFNADIPYEAYEAYEDCVSIGRVWINNSEIIYDGLLGPDTELKNISE
jgi:hypothetical protein